MAIDQYPPTTTSYGFDELELPQFEAEDEAVEGPYEDGDGTMFCAYCGQTFQAGVVWVWAMHLSGAVARHCGWRFHLNCLGLPRLCRCGQGVVVDFFLEPDDDSAGAIALGYDAAELTAVATDEGGSTDLGEGSSFGTPSGQPPDDGFCVICGRDDRQEDQWGWAVHDSADPRVCVRAQLHVDCFGRSPGVRCWCRRPIDRCKVHIDLVLASPSGHLEYVTRQGVALPTSTREAEDDDAGDGGNAGEDATDG
jgi:hypothetical protein